MACYVVAEIGQAHDGSLGTAHAYIDAAARAGADAVKFQTHIAAAESTSSEPWRVQFSLQDENRFDYWRRMEFTEPQWVGLKQHADEVGVDFVSSPFSNEAVELLERVGLAAWKIASGEVTNLPLLERIGREGRRVILSSGMSSIDDLDRAVQLFRHAGADLTILQCTSSYPCPPEKVGLNMIAVLRDRYSCPVGLSDHSGTVFAGLAAATLGIDMLEVHVAMSREMFGPDVAASITTDELKLLVEGIRFIETATSNPIDKNELAQEMEPVRRLFTKSVVAAHDISAGHTLAESDLKMKKPGTGIPAASIQTVIGRVLNRDVVADEQLQMGDLGKST